MSEEHKLFTHYRPVLDIIKYMMGYYVNIGYIHFLDEDKESFIEKDIVLFIPGEYYNYILKEIEDNYLTINKDVLQKILERTYPEKYTNTIIKLAIDVSIIEPTKDIYASMSILDLVDKISFKRHKDYMPYIPDDSLDEFDQFIQSREFYNPTDVDYKRVDRALDYIDVKDYVSLDELINTKKITPSVVIDIVNTLVEQNNYDKKILQVLFKEPSIVLDQEAYNMIDLENKIQEEDDLKAIEKYRYTLDYFIVMSLLKATEYNLVDVCKNIVKHLDVDKVGKLLVQDCVLIAEEKGYKQLKELFGEYILL